MKTLYHIPHMSEAFLLYTRGLDITGRGELELWRGQEWKEIPSEEDFLSSGGHAAVVDRCIQGLDIMEGGERNSWRGGQGSGRSPARGFLSSGGRCDGGSKICVRGIIPIVPYQKVLHRGCCSIGDKKVHFSEFSVFLSTNEH
ncbi:hypothetical protein AVEN_145224-1 [Araneus ventricosus]|uniref:Uncharacterized protein n=1 Tax=Araneus ventricosus TaxID=182803 RepID=A0A4Y2L8G2_ARAVE|nr:hypothetical protein AVEN_145224-1 [Araneus ventricosus]